ncbi:MAG: hypothetical protein [Wendovervirus sonii]|uniref:Uncharacterized protein n=1 Tax=phage Lak_Megaphage_Sonny TaxID=3109229 RepID=A0ABZ0Z3I3_9CAUD|nr:MAG: hypothetical protein [phage Lak_Megaphage_Sonny]
MTIDDYLFEIKDYAKYGLLTPVELCKEIYQPKLKIHILSDFDPWYVVNYIEDEQKKDKVETLIIIKSWAKHKQKWVYHIDNIEHFIIEQEIVANKFYPNTHKFKKFLRHLEDLP